MHTEDGQSWQPNSDQGQSLEYIKAPAEGFPKFLIISNFDSSELLKDIKMLEDPYHPFHGEIASTIAERFRLFVYNHWESLVCQYNKRRITIPTDVFPALAGLAETFGAWLGDEYFAGLWSGNLLHGLMWTCPMVPSDEPPYDGPDQSALAPCDFDAPGWSWAGVYGFGIKYNEPRYAAAEYEFASVRVLPAAAPGGQSGRRRLKIKTLFRQFASREQGPLPLRLEIEALFHQVDLAPDLFSNGNMDPVVTMGYPVSGAPWSKRASGWWGGPRSSASSGTARPGGTLCSCS